MPDPVDVQTKSYFLCHEANGRTCLCLPLCSHLQPVWFLIITQPRGNYPIVKALQMALPLFHMETK